MDCLSPSRWHGALTKPNQQPPEFRKEISESLLSRNGHFACASEFSAMRTSLLVREGDLHHSPEYNPARIHGGFASFEALVASWLAQLY